MIRRTQRYLVVRLALLLWSLDRVLHRAMDRVANQLYFSAKPWDSND